ncbi:hypothetical protein [Singulisphaera sp. PoT]|uniref:hypothetical protein n=1 Tax=Singulisphaera sp. PoT TaxID=3411797 RepID=UPI003BF4E897
MNTATKSDLSARPERVIKEARGKVEAFQAGAESEQQEIRGRFEKFLIAEQIVGIAREKLEQLREQLEVEIVPA